MHRDGRSTARCPENIYSARDTPHSDAGNDRLSDGIGRHWFTVSAGV
ncbi:hypothetical protein [Lysobacter gummosus]